MFQFLRYVIHFFWSHFFHYAFWAGFAFERDQAGGQLKCNCQNVSKGYFHLVPRYRRPVHSAGQVKTTAIGVNFVAGSLWKKRPVSCLSTNLSINCQIASDSERS